MDSETDMMVDLLANNQKLLPEENRWAYNKKDMKSIQEVSQEQEEYIENQKNDTQAESVTELDDNLSSIIATKEKKPQVTLQGDSKPVLFDKNEKMLKKLDILRKLSELAQSGTKLSQNYNLNSDYDMMLYEYELHKNVRAKQNGINWMSSMFMNLVYGIEMMNDKYNPFDLKLKGWSETVHSDLGNYYEVFGELYEKYNAPGQQMAPEMRFLFMISASAIKFHLTNSLMSKLPSLGSLMKPDAIQNILKEKTQKEHEVATQKASDIQMLKKKETEMELKKGLESLKPTDHIQQQPLQIPVFPESLQKALLKKTKDEEENMKLQKQVLEIQYINELERLKKIKSLENQEDDISLHSSKKSYTSSISSSVVTMNKNIDKILEQTRDEITSISSSKSSRRRK